MAKTDNALRGLFDLIPLPRMLHVRRLERQLARLRRKGRSAELLTRFGHLWDHPVDGPHISPYLADCLLQTAEPDLERVRTLIAAPCAQTEFADYWYCRAHVHHRLGQYSEALSAYARVISDSAFRPWTLPLALPLASSHAAEPASVAFLQELCRFPETRPVALFHLGVDAELGGSLPTHSVRSVLSARDGVSRGHGVWRSLGDPTAIRLACFKPDGTPAPDRITMTYEPYVAELVSATVVSGSSLVHVGASTIVSDLLADYELAKFVCLRGDPTVMALREGGALVRRIESTERIAEGVNLCGMSSSHFGHWFAEYLPRLRHFIRHPRFAEVPIIVDEGMPASHYEFLRALVPNRQHLLARGAALLVDRLWVAPTINFFPPALQSGHLVPPDRQAAWSVDALRFFAERLRPGRREPGSRRLFLSRRNSSWRRLANEAELVAALAPHGFEVVCLEDLGFADQVSTLGEAGFIIAPNGSALNNLIFTSPRTKVVVFGQRHFHNWGGWLGPFQDLGYQPVFITGEPLQAAAEKHADYVISVEEAMRTVHRLLAQD
jgi:capsular polysaccharide biosynthesis protein